jgi:hypothetical protein
LGLSQPGLVICLPSLCSKDSSTCVLFAVLRLCCAVLLLPQLLCDLGMVACTVASLTPPAPDYLSVTLDGKVVGYLPACVADKVVRR